jgi:hypothetical protein
MSRFLLTREVEDLLGCKYWPLRALLRDGRISPPPRKSLAGYYLWGPADIARAREALKTYRPRKYALKPQPTA